MSVVACLSGGEEIRMKTEIDYAFDEYSGSPSHPPPSGSPSHPPPPPPPPAGPSGTSGASDASGSSQSPPPPLPPSNTQGGQSTEELHMGDDTTVDEHAYSSSGEDIGRDHISTSTYTPPPENSLLPQIGDMATFMDWYCKKQGISELTQKDLEGPAYEIVKVFHPDVVHLQFQMEEYHKLLT
ncbi:hypothetical protein Tco_1535350, partial [Tanacetum coccineum]